MSSWMQEVRSGMMNAFSKLPLIYFFTSGGTLDTTAYRIAPEKSFQQIHQVSGKDMGGTKVDEAFVEFLKRLLGKDVVEALKIGCDFCVSLILLSEASRMTPKRRSMLQYHLVCTK